MTRAFLAVIGAFFACAAAAADIGAVVLHGKWGSPEGLVKPLAEALARDGFLVASPDMPWSRQRAYARSVADANAELDAEIGKLAARGAKRVFIVGHSLGAAFALQYATRAAVAGIAAVAPGHRPEAPRIAAAFRSDVSAARELVAAGKGDRRLTFTDINTGNRRARMSASAAAFVSYFDPDGPMNMTRNAAAVKPGVPVLWIVPSREEEPLRTAVLAISRRLPANASTRLVEPAADHLDAPAASAALIAAWMREVAAAGR